MHLELIFLNGKFFFCLFLRLICFYFSLQNVYSKILISGEHHRYTAIELQFWASFIACFLQFPLTFYYVPVPTALTLTSNYLIILYILNGFAYHIQAVAAYAIMAYISPITHRFFDVSSCSIFPKSNSKNISIDSLYVLVLPILSNELYLSGCRLSFFIIQ